MKALHPATILLMIICMATWAQAKIYMPDAAPSETPLNLQLQKACATGDLASVTKFIAQGASIESRDKRGATPLMFAAMNNQKDVLNLLLDKGAKLEIKEQGNTALMFACVQNYHDIAMTLIARGANCNPVDPAASNGYYYYPLLWAARFGDVVLLKELLDRHANINYSDERGTALDCAFTYHQWGAINFLISKGADPNVPDTSKDGGYTPLMNLARMNRALSEVKVLLKAGADPNLKSRQAKTALMYASLNGNFDMTQALVEGGADINATSDKGETALTLAGGLSNIVEFLKSKGARRTDVQIIAREKPTVPLTSTQAWALAVGAVYNLRNDTNPNLLGAGDTRTQRFMQDDLKNGNDVQDTKGLLQKLDYITTTGDRADAQARGARLVAQSNSIFEILLGLWMGNPIMSRQDKTAKECYLKWKDRTGLGLDICAYVNLVNVGYKAGYLTEKQSWPLLIANAQLAQKNFSSWQELGENFLDSREVIDGTRDPRYDAFVQLLNNPHDTNSPWNEYPWNTNLSDSGF